MSELVFPNMTTFDIGEVLGSWNTNTGDLFWAFMIFVLFIIILSLTYFNGLKMALTSSSLISVIISLFFLGMGLVSWVVLIAWGSIFLLSLLYFFIG